MWNQTTEFNKEMETCLENWNPVRTRKFEDAEKSFELFLSFFHFQESSKFGWFIFLSKGRLQRDKRNAKKYKSMWLRFYILGVLLVTRVSNMRLNVPRLKIWKAFLFDYYSVNFGKISIAIKPKRPQLFYLNQITLLENEEKRIFFMEVHKQYALIWIKSNKIEYRKRTILTWS